MVTLITGGARSGKSSYALELARVSAHRAFVATGVALDDEMRIRIERHKQARGSDFVTIEEPYDPAAGLLKLPPSTDAAIIDCVTMWLSNLLCRESKDEYEQIEAFLKGIRNPPCDLLIVTNEVGQGIVPDSALGRKFRDLQGTVNRRIAELADRVVLMVSGIPIVIKKPVQSKEGRSRTAMPAYAGKDKAPDGEA
jgi:adenosylcobinamide kinase/adenosylcobinamide-phosphate guanylyltransferase